MLEWCDRQALGLEERLRLFFELCGAVHYAHRNLAVHRDLMPTNVMVTREGVPTLLDFGIARTLEAEEGEVQTVTAEQRMTPEYASPEQVRGEPIATATEVYALGAVLFELLTGARAQPVTSLAEAIRILCEQPVLPPSSVVRDPARARAIRGDLDTIVAMAMRKELERRYPTARELGEGVSRFLARLPVRAQRDTAAYRLRRCLVRDQVAAALTAMALVFLVIAGTTLVREMIVRTAQEYPPPSSASRALCPFRGSSRRALEPWRRAVAPGGGSGQESDRRGLRSRGEVQFSSEIDVRYLKVSRVTDDGMNSVSELQAWADVCWID